MPLALHQPHVGASIDGEVSMDARNALIFIQQRSAAATKEKEIRRMLGEVSMGFGFTRSAALGHAPKHE